MAKLLVLFASSYGQTKKIAERLASTWRSHGHDVVTADLGARLPPSPERFDAVLIGSRLAVSYAGSVRRYVRKHRVALGAVRSAFFSVSMSAASSDPAVRALPDQKTRQFLAELGWSPSLVASFAGALPYTKYDVVTRLIMKLISSRAGHTTDTSRDHEFTDWAAVGRFAAQVEEALHERAVANPAA